MATPKEEEDNFIKMFKLVTGVGTDSLRDEFDRQFPPPDLVPTLTKHEPTLKKLNTERRLTSKQMSLLFPSSASPTSQDFDVTLMICLIRNLTGVLPPSKGFDKLPMSSENTTGADIARIKYYRNMLAHADTNRIPAADFNSGWQNLSDAIVRLGGSHKNFKKECDHIKSLKILSDTEVKTLHSEVVLFKNIYKEELRELKRKIDDFQDVRLKVEEMETEVSEVISAKIQRVSLKVDEIETKVSEVIPVHIQEVRLKVDKLETKVSEVIPVHIQEVRLKVDKLETKVSEVIPVHIQDQKQKQLELWQKKDQMFVSTGATEHVYKCITENSCVTVTGNSGVGKTFIVRHVALIMKGEGYTVVPTCIPKDIRDFTKPGSKTLFVVDDICGHYTLNLKYLDDWKLMLPDITLLLENNDCKIIATCRLQVFKDEKFKSLSVFTSNECNLNSEELCLTADEKSSLAKKYFDDQASKVSQMSAQYEFFPLLCSLYDKDKFSDLSLFFSKPFDCYKQELDHLLNEGDEGRYKYCVLALVVMFNNKLSKDHFSCDYSKIIENTLVKCKLNKGTSVECLKDALLTLEGTFVVKDKDCYKTVHDKLFDFLANYFGDKMLKHIIINATSEFLNERILWNTPDNTETAIDFTIYLPDNCLDMYISRLVNDWSDGKVLRLFSSRNLKSPTFIVKLLDHIKQHDKSFQVKLANVTVDNYYHNTTLLQSCFVGDVNLTQWILDNTVYNGRCDSIVNKCRDDGTSPVYIACEYGHLSVLDRLIECKADINKCRDDGTSPVFIACQNGHLSVLDRLIECKADINKCKEGGNSPLHAACYCNHIDVVLVLLKLYKKNKVMIDLCDDWGGTPLYDACEQGCVQIVTLLLQHGANPHQCNKWGESPLQVADIRGHVDVVTAIKEFIPITV